VVNLFAQSTTIKPDTYQGGVLADASRRLICRIFFVNAGSKAYTWNDDAILTRYTAYTDAVFVICLKLSLVSVTAAICALGGLRYIS
jgi:hypothetical protein